MCSPLRDPIPSGDVDIYCQTQRAFDFCRKEIERIRNQTYESEVALTFGKVKKEDEPCNLLPTIQLIKPRKTGNMVATGPMQEVLENFDFTVVRAGLLSPDTALVDRDFWDDEKHQRLQIKNIHCPVGSTYRCAKYIKKGYSIRPKEMIKLFLDWDQRDEEYRDLLKTNLIKGRESGLTQEEIDELEALLWID